MVTANRGNGTRLVPVTSEEDAQAYTAQVICPIIADGESIGAVVLLSREPAARMGDTELKVAETTASIVGRQRKTSVFLFSLRRQGRFGFPDSSCFQMNKRGRADEKDGIFVDARFVRIRRLRAGGDGL